MMGLTTLIMPKQTPKLNPQWIKETRDRFRKFLTITKFPHPVRNGTRGSPFDYPEWLIMFIAVLAVKAKAKNYLAIHRLTLQYWPILSERLPSKLRAKPMSERQLRDRLKKSAIRLEGLRHSFFRYFLTQSSMKKVSADKMMVKARGPVWHQKQKRHGIVPKGLRGLDRQATWGKSRADGWVYGHGTFSITPHGIPIVGLFQWMPNSGNEAKRMAEEIIKYAGVIGKVCMDSKADDQNLYWHLKRNHRIQLVTVP